MCYIQNNGPCSICGRLSNPMIEGSGCNCGNSGYYFPDMVLAAKRFCKKCNKDTHDSDYILTSYPPQLACKDCGTPRQRSFLYQDIIDNTKQPTIYDKPGVITTSTTTDSDDTTLKDLYDELGKLKWTDEDKGWDEAIEAVRAHIRTKL